MWKERFLFNLICIWNPLIDILNTDKNIFRCIEPEIFSSTLNVLINFMKKYPVIRFRDYNNRIKFSIQNRYDLTKNLKAYNKIVANSQENEYK